jgi:hypothetical protein
MWMKPERWKWVWLGVVLLQTATAALKAFSKPWAWTTSQWLLVFWCLILFALAVRWGVVLARHGRTATLARMDEAIGGVGRAYPPNQKTVIVAYAGWIAVLTSLVILVYVNRPT